MVYRVYFLLVAICMEFGPSLQQRKHFQKRLDYVEAKVTSVSFKTQLDLSKLRDTVELLNNTSEELSSALANISPPDAATIADFESEMKKEFNQQKLTITAISKAVSAEKKYIRQQIDDALEILSETATNKSIDNIKADIMETKEINNQLKEEVQYVKSDLMNMNRKLKTEVEENRKEILELRQMIMDMQQERKEVAYSSATVTVPTSVPPCPAGWLTFQSTCYLYIENDRVSWDEAKTRCADRGGILAEPDTEEELRYLIGAVADNTWLGGTDRHTESSWVWSSTQRDITFFLWDTNQPNSWGGDQDCLETLHNALNDDDCLGKKQKYICETRASV